MMHVFNITCDRWNDAAGAPEQYVVAVEVDHDARERQFYARAPKWGCSKGYPDARTAALSLAYENAAHVLKIETHPTRLLAYVYAYEYGGTWYSGESQQTHRSRECSDERGETIADHAAEMGDLYVCGIYARDEGEPGATLFMQV